MITCPRCGGQAPDGTPYCPYCGYGKPPAIPSQNIPANQPLINQTQPISNPNQQNINKCEDKKHTKKEQKRGSCLSDFLKIIGIALIIIIVLPIFLNMCSRSSNSSKTIATATISPEKLMDDAIKTAEVLHVITEIPESTKTSVPAITKNNSDQNAETSTTSGNSRALNEAKRYLRAMAFSRKGLIDQLKYEGYSQSDSEYAVDNCGADWYEQAALKAKSYLSAMNFSKESLIEQLEYEGFTHDESVYGASAVDISEIDQAIGKANSYLSFSNFSKSGLIDQLEYEGFSHDIALDAVNQIDVDWNEQARDKAKSYLDFMSFSYYELIDQLEYEGFTHDQAVYGANIVN